MLNERTKIPISFSSPSHAAELALPSKRAAKNRHRGEHRLSVRVRPRELSLYFSENPDELRREAVRTARRFTRGLWAPRAYCCVVHASDSTAPGVFASKASENESEYTA
jgi:hypothetical protein